MRQKYINFDMFFLLMKKYRKKRDVASATSLKILITHYSLLISNYSLFPHFLHKLLHFRHAALIDEVVSRRMRGCAQKGLPIHRHIALDLASADVYDLDLLCGNRLCLRPSLSVILHGHEGRT